MLENTRAEDVDPEDRHILEKLAKLQQMSEQVNLYHLPRGTRPVFANQNGCVADSLCRLSAFGRSYPRS